MLDALYSFVGVVVGGTIGSMGVYVVLVAQLRVRMSDLERRVEMIERKVVYGAIP